MERVVNDLDTNQEYDYMVDLLASNKEASIAFIEICDKHSVTDKINTCKEGLSDELLAIVSDIEEKNDQIDSLIYSLNVSLKTLYDLKMRFSTCQKCTVETNINILEERLSNLSSVDN